jgi:putative SOS response-associated peptidase YedK
MFERYSFALPKDKAARRYGVKIPYPLEAHYNISPGTRASVIRDRSAGLLSPAEWGMTGPPAKNGKVPKVVAALPLGGLLQTDEGDALLSRRCLVPADGYYAWRQVTRRSRVPYRVTLKWNLPFAFAGVWTEEGEEGSEKKTTFAVLTTAPNELLLPFGAQMPLVLPLDEEKSWLEEGVDLHRLAGLSFPAGQMKLFPVSPQVNRKELNSPALIEPVQATDQFGNYMLFE